METPIFQQQEPHHHNSMFNTSDGSRVDESFFMPFGNHHHHHHQKGAPGSSTLPPSPNSINSTTSDIEYKGSPLAAATPPLVPFATPTSEYKSPGSNMSSMMSPNMSPLPSPPMYLPSHSSTSKNNSVPATTAGYMSQANYYSNDQFSLYGNYPIPSPVSPGQDYLLLDTSGVSNNSTHAVFPTFSLPPPPPLNSSSPGLNSDNSMIRPTKKTAKKAKPAKENLNEEANLECPHDGCDKKFSRHFNLKSHMRSHTAERNFRCDQCNAAFRRSHDLKRHVGSLHVASKAYGCTTCGKRFARTDALKRHVSRPNTPCTIVSS